MPTTVVTLRYHRLRDRAEDRTDPLGLVAGLATRGCVRRCCRKRRLRSSAPVCRADGVVGCRCAVARRPRLAAPPAGGGERGRGRAREGRVGAPDARPAPPHRSRPERLLAHRQPGRRPPGLQHDPRIARRRSRAAHRLRRRAPARPPAVVVERVPDRRGRSALHQVLDQGGAGRRLGDGRVLLGGRLCQPDRVVTRTAWGRRPRAGRSAPRRRRSRRPSSGPYRSRRNPPRRPARGRAAP
ncbi:hypothetical protein P3T36_006628 [Kitasatospora sp. MAP12-15]|nr:hypothetical protein [Kitasatospora sp. MAP12-44]